MTVWLHERLCRFSHAFSVLGLSFDPRNPHIPSMATWQKTITKQPPKSKAELREMLTQAVRNTQPESKSTSKAGKDQP